jgi:phenylalanyl-tRNA synthetase beta chain
MKITWNWLSEFVDLELSPTALGDRLTMAGLELDSIEEHGREVAGVVCAQIVRVRPHPRESRLSLCDVRSGDASPVSVVCGAPNVHAGERVAYAPPGALLPGARRIEAAEIQGETSVGMLCSEAELGLGADSSGILILPADARIGARIGEILQLEDTVLDIAVTPNRGDCLSVLGLAREIAALTGRHLRRRRITARESHEAVEDLVNIGVEDAELCRRYVGRVITGIEVGPSPLWMQYRLRAVGVRAINNIVDVTNYVMIERGQPLHAFDFDRLPQPEINVRRAGSSSRFTTLDGQERELHPDDLLIVSGDRPVAVAGVMGGADTEVHDDTRRILLESAWFHPSSVRRTAKRLGLRSEASYRFERGTDLEGVPLAADRAASMILQLAGGQLCRGRGDAYPSPHQAAPIALRLQRVTDVLGMDVSRAEIVSALKALGMAASAGARRTLTVVPPAYRSDLSREIDLIEEVARVVGYDRVPVRLPECTLAGADTDPAQTRERDAKRFLTAQGLSETVLLSFCSPRLNQIFSGFGQPRQPVIIRNPLTQEEAELRFSLCPSLLAAVRENLRQGLAEVALFSLGKVFWQDQGPAEAMRLAGVVCRTVPRVGLGSRDQLATFAVIKGIVEGLCDWLGAAETQWRPFSEGAALHPGKAATVEIDGTEIGVVGAVHPDVAEELEIDLPCWLFELDLRTLLKYCPRDFGFTDLPRFPVVVRDVAVVAEGDFGSDQVIRFVREWDKSTRLIEDVRLFDQYAGAPIPAGKKSLAYTISYRAADRTLTDAEINDVHTRLIAAMQAALSVEPR